MGAAELSISPAPKLGSGMQSLEPRNLWVQKLRGSAYILVIF